MGILYFAYGSNLDPDQFKMRCPSSQKIDRATLADHQLLFSNRGYATIRPAKNNTVYGVVYELSREDAIELDRFEGVASNLYREEQKIVTLFSGLPKEAMVYIDDHWNNPREPGNCYLKKIEAGYRVHQLPAESLEAGRRAGSRQNLTERC